MIEMTMIRIDSDGANWVAGDSDGCTITYSDPARAEIPPATANAESFARDGETVDAAAISSLSRTAMKLRPIPVARILVTIQAVTMSAPRHRR